MSMNVPALKVDVEKINYNFQQGLIGEGEKITGNTGTNYQGLGVANNASSSDDIAAFFAPYATEQPETWFQQIDVNSEKGQAFMKDLYAFTGDDGYLSQEELQAWADQNKYRGDINTVMQALADVDNVLFGKGTMDIEYVDEATLNPTEETLPEETAPEETLPDETKPNEEDGQTDFTDVLGAVGNWAIDGIKWLTGVDLRNLF